MANLTAIKQTYQETTNREALSNMIQNISPYDTPIYSMCGTDKATSTKEEWPEDALAAPAANAHVEGASDVAVTIGVTSRSRLYNYTQIFKKHIEISETQNAVDPAGVTNESDYQAVNKMRELATDVEYAIVNNATAVAGSASVARQLGGIPAFVTTNVLENSGTTRFNNETLLNDAIQLPWDAGAQVKDIVMSGKNKRRVSAFSANTQKTTAASDKKLIASVNTYDSDFGLVTFHASRYMADTTIFGIDKERIKVATLRPFKRTPLPATNDSKDEILKGELTLKVMAEKAHFILKDLKVV